jgi:hypothetical protein
MDYLEEARVSLNRLTHSEHIDILDMTHAPEIESDLGMAHIGLTRETGEPISNALLALERLILPRVQNGNLQ